MRHILRSYADGVYFEFLVAEEAREAVVLLDGFPSSNDRQEEMRLLLENGYNVFYPRYKGTFQSDGAFLETDPSITMSQFLDSIQTGSTRSLWDEQEVMFHNEAFHLVSGSFGGAVSLAVAHRSQVDSVLLFSPVWNFDEHNESYKEQDLDHLTSFARRAYKNLYRFNFGNVKDQMERFPSCKPAHYLPLSDTTVTVFHDPADTTTRIEHSRKYVPRLAHGELKEVSFGHGLQISTLRSFIQTK
jgi:esterase/lipase